MDNKFKFQNIFKEGESSNIMEMGIKESSEENCGEPVCRNESALEAEQNSWKASGSIGESKSNENCPLSKQSLGRHSWPLLHTMAAYYPKTPSEKEQNSMISFIEALSIFYPCKECRLDFSRQIKINKPKVKNNEELSIWFCKQHNNVNLKLGKELYDCSWENLEKRWKTGGEHCKK